MKQSNLEKYHRLIFCIYDDVSNQVYKKNRYTIRHDRFIERSVWEQVRFENKSKVLNQLKKDLSNGKY